MAVERARKRGSAIYGGEDATMNIQTLMDIRVVRDLHAYVSQNGGQPGSYSAIVKEVVYWLHELLIEQGEIVPSETIEEAVEYFRQRGFNVGQFSKSDRRYNGLKKGLSAEAMRADFGGSDPRANAEALLSDEDIIKKAAAQFLQADIDQTVLEREALGTIPDNLKVEKDDA